jgi:biopolymer transport protein TolQ
MDDFSVIDLFLQASLIVQSVMLLLSMVSIISWIVIFERYFNLNRIKEANKALKKNFGLVRISMSYIKVLMKFLAMSLLAL